MPAVESRLERLVHPWCFAAVGVGWACFLLQVWREGGEPALRELGGLASASVVLVGKFVIFWAVHDDTHFSPWALGLMVWLIDLVIAFSLLSGLETLERAFVLGGWLRRARRKAIHVMGQYPGLERMAFLGVAVYVMLPLAATGAVTGSFAARLAGLTRLAGVAAIALGSFGTSFVFALLAQLLGARGEELLLEFLASPFLMGSLLVALALVGRSAWIRLTRRLKQP